LSALWFHNHVRESIVVGPTFCIAHVDVGHHIRVTVARKFLTRDGLMSDRVLVDLLHADTVIELACIFSSDLREATFRITF
jgi:hypothetical protein